MSFLEGNHIQQLIQKGDISRAELLAAVAKMVAPATASAMKGNREEILAQGFDGYVSKPIDAAVLRQAIREVLA